MMLTSVYVLHRLSTNCTLGQPHSLQHKVSGRALSGHALCGHALSGHALSGHALSGHALSGHALETVCIDVLGDFYTVRTHVHASAPGAVCYNGLAKCLHFRGKCTLVQ